AARCVRYDGNTHADPGPADHTGPGCDPGTPPAYDPRYDPAGDPGIPVLADPHHHPHHPDRDPAEVVDPAPEPGPVPEVRLTGIKEKFFSFSWFRGKVPRTILVTNYFHHLKLWPCLYISRQ